VPGLSPVQISVPVVVTVTSVPMDCTRFPWAGGEAPDELVELVHGVPGGRAAINHVVHPCALVWSGLSVLVGVPPRPPPT